MSHDPSVAPSVQELRQKTQQELRIEGYAFLARGQATLQIGSSEPDGMHDWEAFAETWEDLGVDGFMADRGRYRRRRHGVFSCRVGESLVRLADAPHYQELEHNRLNGGMDRTFLPVEDRTAATASFRTLAAYGLGLFDGLEAGLEGERADWIIEAHQFRIEARPGVQGLPTPEGVHRDGVDYVLVALVNRVNIQSGTTTIHSANGDQLGEFTLTDPLDLALVDDHRVWHGVTAVEALDPDAPAWRDVLVLTYRRPSQ
ncbi:MAG: hypothetical protein ACJA2W_001547 [Planctomycetota bacterium]|jgi:hypothetical protein